MAVCGWLVYWCAGCLLPVGGGRPVSCALLGVGLAVVGDHGGHGEEFDDGLGDDGEG